MSDDFLYRNIPILGKRVHRYGLSASYGLDEAGMREGLERGPRPASRVPALRAARNLRTIRGRTHLLVAAVSLPCALCVEEDYPFSAFAHSSRSSALHAAVSDALTMSLSRPAPKRTFASRPRRPT